MKKCPYCAEKIQDKAVICQYCGKELPTESPKPTTGAKPKQRKLLLPAALVLGGLILVTVGLFLFGKPETNHPLLFAMDFENKAVFFGWHVGGPDQGYYWLENTQDGKYVYEFPSGFLETEDLQFSDLEVSVDVEFLSETRMDTSVSCRLKQGEGYGFVIANDGKWAITKSYQSQWIELARGWSAEIQLDSNRLAGRCVGDRLTLLVNGVELGSAQDGDLTIGGINFGYNADQARGGTLDNIRVESWGDQKLPTTSGADTNSAPSVAEVLATATPSQESIPSEAPTPTAILTPTLTPEGLFYANHFEDGDLGLDDWIVHGLAYSIRHDHENKPYTFAKNEDQKLVVDSNGVDPFYAIYDVRLPTADLTISSEMEFEGEGTASFSLVCRYSEIGWYELGISNQGAWWIRLTRPDGFGVQHSELAAGESDAIFPGINKVEASCSGTQLSLRVNGELLGTVEAGLMNENEIFGLAYQEDLGAEVSAELSTLEVISPEGRKYLEKTFERDSFNYSMWLFAGSLGAPAEVYALVVPNANLEVESGRAQVTANRKMGWIALYPGELPYNVEIAVDIDLDRFDYDQGFGLVCRWWDQPATYMDQNTGGYVLWILKTYVIVTPFYVDGDGIVHGSGTAEFSNTSFVNLLEGKQHHLMARCWNELVEFYVDGELVARHKTTDFPYAGNNKAGSMVGLMFVARDAGSAAWIDNLTISWDLAPTPTGTP